MSANKELQASAKCCNRYVGGCGAGCGGRCGGKCCRRRECGPGPSCCTRNSVGCSYCQSAWGCFPSNPHSCGDNVCIGGCGPRTAVYPGNCKEVSACDAGADCADLPWIIARKCFPNINGFWDVSFLDWLDICDFATSYDTEKCVFDKCTCTTCKRCCCECKPKGFKLEIHYTHGQRDSLVHCVIHYQSCDAYDPCAKNCSNWHQETVTACIEHVCCNRFQLKFAHLPEFIVGGCRHFECNKGEMVIPFEIQANGFVKWYVGSYISPYHCLNFAIAPACVQKRCVCFAERCPICCGPAITDHCPDTRYCKGSCECHDKCHCEGDKSDYNWRRCSGNSCGCC